MPATAIASNGDQTAFAYLRRLIYDSSAIVLDGQKDYLFESRLGTILRQESLPSFEALVARITSPAGGPLRQRVIEAMTTNETSFFRDIHPFDALRAHVLPQIGGANAQERSLAIWSAACSTGQELYSIAMLIREQQHRFPSWNIHLVGTDLSSDVVNKARAGVFSQLEVNRGLPAPMLLRHFTKVGPNFHVKDDLKQMVQFRTMNLIEHWPPLARFDVVMLRNVLIYFDVATKRRILDRVAQVMRPGGLLFLGGAETTLNLSNRFAELHLDKASCHRLIGA